MLPIYPGMYALPQVYGWLLSKVTPLKNKTNKNKTYSWSPSSQQLVAPQLAWDFLLSFCLHAAVLSDRSLKSGIKVSSYTGHNG